MDGSVLNVVVLDGQGIVGNFDPSNQPFCVLSCGEGNP